MSLNRHSKPSAQFRHYHGRVAEISGLVACWKSQPCGDGKYGGVHASPNVTKTVLDWEYTRDILRSDLRAYLKASHHQLSAEGSRPQGQGGTDAQSIPPKTTSGGEPHV